jgi:hypothetical protein
MPFPPTPSQTASNTPTPSITPSVTPSFTPTNTECPSEQLITYGSYSSNSCGNFPLTSYTSYIRYNSTNYPLTDVSVGFGNQQLGDCIPIRYPYVGLVYRFDFLIDPNLGLCNALAGYYYDRIDYQVISFDGIIGGIPTYTITERYYLNNVLVDTITLSQLSIVDQTVETCSVNIGGIFPEFRVQIPVTPTPSVTPTITPTITQTMTQTPSPTATFGLTPSQTQTPSYTPSQTVTQTMTQSPTPSTCLDFNISYLCNTESNDATVYVSGFTCGSGQYDINQVLYLTQSGATSGIYIQVNSSVVSYFTVENNTWWVCVKDRNNPSNIVCKSVTTNC